MSHGPRITDHTQIIQAAREDASREGARIVMSHLLQLSQLLHRAPRPSPGDRQRLAAALYID